ncbi:MAG TPA: SpoIIE family protein phosphatase [Tepidisphaeraceae bacterium]|jgi:serine phosphatase RsbU (regulator of sigma subunit)|nr:SpoIIE family protein phosphatase [Tepidisphaeraceae bacterium]
MSTPAGNSAWLIPLPGGPPIEPLELKSAPGGVVIGRHEHCLLRLPVEAEQVSRQHARFSEHAGHWRVTDLHSRWGTFLNGVKIPPNREMPLSDGDLLRIVPWTFSFSTHGVPQRALRSVDDATTAGAMIRSHGPERAIEPLQDDLLHLLLESASAIHGAEDEKSLANLLMDIACRGTGLHNAAVLRALDSAGRIEVVMSRVGPTLREPTAMGFSRSLLTTASQGVLAEMSATSTGDFSQSIIQMNVDAAICVPLMLGSTVAAYLYLDSRGGSHAPRTLRPNAAGFCVALAKIAGLALANLKRLDIERRSAQIEAELKAAMAAQRWILPREKVCAGSFVCAGTSRPGEYVGGDFFDAIVLPDNRLVVALGDVSGHGVAASVLMTATQGFFHAAITQHGDLARAVKDLNAFVHPRRPETIFVTLWVGLFDPKKMTVSYVDAGHGYALLANPDRTFQSLSEGDAVPVGIMPDSTYSVTTHPLPPNGRALVISDGLVEQPTLEPGPGQSREQFGIERVQASVAEAKTDEDAIARLFDAVYQFAGTQSLSDDATAVLVKW